MDERIDGENQEAEATYSPDWLIDSGCVEGDEYGGDYAPTADADSHTDDFGIDPYIGEQYED